MEQLAAMPPLLEVPGMRKSLMWGIGCGILGAIHRLRQGKGPLLSASRGIACFGTAFAVSWFAESRAEARDQVLQQRVKDALQKTREKDAQAARLPASSAASSTSTVGSATTVSSISDNSNSQPHIEFTDTDGDRICFRIDARTCQLVYEVRKAFALDTAPFMTFIALIIYRMSSCSPFIILDRARMNAVLPHSMTRFAR